MNPNNPTAPDNIRPTIFPKKTLAEKMALLQRQKEKLAQKAAALNKEARKERDGQLIAWASWLKPNTGTVPRNSVNALSLRLTNCSRRET